MALGHGACPCCRWCPGLSLLPGPLKGNLPWLATPNTATVNMIPSLSGGGVPRRGRCALVLCPPPRAGPVLLCPNSKAKLGASTPPLPGCGFKAAGQCKLGFPGPARLLLLLRASVLPAEAASLQGASDVVPAPDRRIHLQKSGQMCVLNARHRTVFAFAQAGEWRPQTGIHLNGLVFVSHSLLASRLQAARQEGCHGRLLPMNPVHGIPRGAQHLLLSTRLGPS